MAPRDLDHGMNFASRFTLGAFRKVVGISTAFHKKIPTLCDAYPLLRISEGANSLDARGLSQPACRY